MSDYELVGWVAKTFGISDYDVFHRAAVDYGPRMLNRFERDFTKYVVTGLIPFYVRCYCNRHRDRIVNKYE